MCLVKGSQVGKIAAFAFEKLSAVSFIRDGEKEVVKLEGSIRG